MTSPHTPQDSPLGKASGYADQYDAALLFPIPRAPQRATLAAGAQRQFFGADLWTAYELSWLNLRGKPQVAIATWWCRAKARTSSKASPSSCT